MEAQEFSPEEYNEIKVETLELLNQIEETLNTNKKSITGEVLNGLFRNFHNIKGIGGFLNLPSLTQLANASENVLDAFRKTNQTVDATAYKHLDEVTRVIRSILEDGALGSDQQNIEASQKRCLQSILRYLQSLPNTPAPVAKIDPNEDSTAHSITEQDFQDIYQDIQNILQQIETEKLNIPSIKKILPITNKIAKNAEKKVSGKTIAVLNNLQGLLEENQQKGIEEKTDKFQFILESFEYFLGLLFIEKNLLPTSILKKEKQRYESLYENFAVESSANIQKKQNELFGRVGDTSNFSFRIEVENMVTLLEAVESMVEKIDGLDFQMQKLPEKLFAGVQLKEEVRSAQVQAILLRDMFLRITRVPLKHLFYRFVRVIKNAAQLMQKEVEFEMIGENLEIDRSLLSPLNVAIMHLLRNSCDHGIETQAQRILLDKPPAGLIIIKAWVHNDSLKISIKDDGQGLDPEKIKQKLLGLQWYSAEQLAKMTKNEIFQEIFRPGFSTSQSVSDISGRGVGMDVVKKEMAKIHGKVAINSTTGQGVEIVLSIPYV